MTSTPFRFLSDLRLSAVVLAVLAVASGVGTIVESHYSNLGSLETGRAAVYDLVYDAPWFNALLGLLFLNLVLNLVRRLRHGRHPLSYLLVHVGLVVVLAGAGLTRWWGYEGTLHVREGESNALAASNDLYAVAALDGVEAALPVRLYRPGEQDHRLRTELGGASVELGVAEFWPRYAESGPTTDPNAPAAARLYLERDGERAEAVCVRGDDARTVELGGRAYGLRYGSVLSELPYSIHLEQFVLETYPGSDNPASYESHVRIVDPERGLEGRTARIWMNHPLTHRGTKHFQASYDRDRRGTYLAINRDPGKLPTYAGYALLTLGFLVITVRIILRRVAVLRALAKAGAVAAACTLAAASGVVAQEQPATDGPPVLRLSPENLEAASRLIVQDARGRMKPLDTLARETSIKITKSPRFQGREPVETFLGFLLHPEAWFGHPAIHARNPGVRKLLGLEGEETHAALSSVMLPGGYKLSEVVEEAHRTPANRRDKTQQKLILFDERVHLLFGALQGNPLRIFPLPDDPDHTWLSIEKLLAALPEDDPRQGEYRIAAGTLFEGLLAGDDERTAEGLRLVHALQHRYGAAVVPSELRIDAELSLNGTRPFVVSTLPYLGGFALLIVAFFLGLLTGRGGVWSWRSPLYLLGMTVFAAGFALHLWGFVLRWIASGRAPLSNGHESLLWVGLAVALAGLLFEAVSRTAAVGALASLLTAVVLGVSMMGTFDPSIGPLMPVLASYWLNIHVTVITASYGFLGLSCLLGLLTLVLVLIDRRRPTSAAVRIVGLLDQLNVDVIIVGLGLLTVGTLLGGVWANESWGRYWGWDPKETWSLVSILIYSMLLHLRWIPRLAGPFVLAVGSFLAIWSIIMTYFGVNYLLMGLHSYAAGDKVAVPLWASLSFAASLLFCAAAWWAWSGRRSAWRSGPAEAPKQES